MIWILLLLAAALFVYKYMVIPRRYWKDKGVPQIDTKLFFRDIWETLNRKNSFTEYIIQIYNDAGDSRYYGLYQLFEPALVVKDPDLLKQITVKDFDHFQDHRPFFVENNEPLWERNLFSLKGQKWKDMRATLSPAFTSSKMRTMFMVISECAEKMVQHFVDKNDEELQSLEMKDIFTRHANDVIASVAFGIKCDSLGQRDNTFYTMGKEATNFSSASIIIKSLVMLLSPTLASLLKLRLFSAELNNFFRDIVVKTIKAREEKNIVRPDMIQLLMEARKNGMKYEEENSSVGDAGFATVEESDIGKSNKHVTYKLSDDDIAAQGLIFFAAGFDSVSAAMSFAAYELTVNPEVQERLMREIEDTLEDCGGKLTYEALMKMTYMDMVVSETLRKWPSAPFIDRVVTKPYVIQPTNKGERPVHLKVNDNIWIPITGYHHDANYFPDPDKFDPERFNEQNKANIKPYTYLPFGMGPRNCIGSRFALLEIKLTIFQLISKFELVVVEKTDIPLKLNKNSFNLQAENGIWVGFKRRSKNN